MAVLNSDLVLAGVVTEKGTVAEDLLAANAVKHRARFGDPGSEPADLVFINACQTESDFTWLAYTVYGNPFARTPC